jgi:hypothetical protein
MGVANMMTHFERFILAQPVPDLGLPALKHPSDVDLAERASILLYGDGQLYERGEESLRKLAIAVGILPGSPEEIKAVELEALKIHQEK